jgi:cation:H+ antiporter
MDMTLTVISFIGGFIFLVAGAELLVRGASRLALAAGLSPLVIGLTIVAFATSAPELSVTLQSTFSGSPDLAVGNIVGSNITNILLVLGLVAVISPFPINQQLVRFDVPILIGCTLIFFLFAIVDGISQLEGLILFLLLLGYIYIVVKLSNKESRAVQNEYKQEYPLPKKKISIKEILFNLMACVLGVVGLVVGSDLLVTASVKTARALGVEELIIGLTIIAIGTSLPEIATSVMAAIRGKRDIATGNIIGSNLFNLLFVGGVTSVVTPGGLYVNQPAITFDIPVMLAVTIACLPIFYNGYRIDRWEGFVFLGYYAAYLGFLALNASQHQLLPVFSQALLLFALPLTGITILVLTWRWFRRPRV